jgi:hypothetical protein
MVKSKIAAYTLSEMLIVMIVSSIVIGVAFTVLTLVQRHMWDIKANLNMNSELNRLEQSLWIDINKYPDISFSKLEDKLVFKSQIDSTVYHFNKDFMTKASDTFNVEINRMVFYFNGNETSKANIDAFKFELPKAYGNQHLFIFKRNDATQFMN